MRVLVATNEQQGQQSNDYAFTVEGELVTAEVAECVSADDCGCGRGFAGLASSRATTTAMVTDLSHVTEAEMRGAIGDWLERSGWGELFRAGNDAGDAELLLGELIDEHLENIHDICASFPVGTVIERSGTTIRARAFPFAA